MMCFRPWPRRTRYGPGIGFVNALGAAVVAVLVATPASGAEPVRILALGDSLTAGYGLARAATYPARLETALGRAGFDVQVINAGVSGDTSAGGLARLDWALAARPHAAIVELGANDGLRGLDPAATEANLDAIVTRLKAAGVRVLLAGMKAPPNLGREYGAEFAALYPRLAEKHQVALIPFFLDGVAAVAGLNQDDGIHPNARGVVVVVRRILPLVKRLLE
jgi:acyl-CoA thioesterase-1